MSKPIIIIAAIILGLAIATIPILLWSYRITHSMKPFRAETLEGGSTIDRVIREFEEVRAYGRSDIGSIPYPKSLLYAGLLVLICFLLAFGAGYILRSKLNAP